MAQSDDERPDRSLDTPARSARAAVRNRRLIRAAQRGDAVARERLATAHLSLVRAVASRYRELGLPYDDLVQEGSVGLLEAIDRFDARYGVAFESYARFRVRRAIRQALTDKARLIRLPKHVVERRRALERAQAELSAAGHPPTPAQLAAATGIPVPAVLEAQSAGLQPISLDQPVLPDGTQLAGLIADDSAIQPELKALAREQTELLDAALQKLPERERRIVRQRWGIEAGPQSDEDLAAGEMLSPRRTQTIGRDALYKLRAALKSDEVSPPHRSAPLVIDSLPSFEPASLLRGD